MSLTGTNIPYLLGELGQLAPQADTEPVWPARSWQLLKEMGALGLSIPGEYGGLDVSNDSLLIGYEQIAGACLTSCFILTQRDSACRRLLVSDNAALRQELLPPLARGELFATVGLSQLTTSRQHSRPVFVARAEGDDFLLEGTIPWVTGASRAQYIVVGATLENDTRQVLLLLPTDMPGVSLGPPLPLMALQGSLTAEIRCDKVRLERRWLLAGPEEKVMAGARGGTGGLQTSCLAIGLAGAAIGYLRSEAQARPGLRPGLERLHATHQQLREEMYRLAHDAEPAPDAVTNLRAQANTLVVQSAQAALIASKGTGFVHPHPAQRWVRQAMFFLVWSCPWPAATATLDYLTFRTDQECM